MCYEKRRKPAIIVSILSVFLVLVGIIMLIEIIYYEANTSTILHADLGDITAKIK